jgi:hypothetical protein
MLGVLTFGTAAGAQQTICPIGSVEDTAGRPCVPLEGGPTAAPSSEEWRADQIAAAVESGQMTQADACADPAYQSVYPDACGATITATATPTATATVAAEGDATGGLAALPETGGIPAGLPLVVLALIAAGGLASVCVLRRS